MAKLLFRLNGVGADESAEVRQLLDDSGIAWYETDAGMFGISVAALWLRDDSQAEQARALLDDYQRQRTQRVREEHRQAMVEGRAPGVWQRFRHDPLRVIFLVAVAIAVLYLSTAPFLGLL